MTTVCIHQPDFAPWLGFFDRLVDSDLYVVFDDVQFLRRAWHHRDRILGANGPLWLTVPVKKKGRYTQEIREVEIDNSTDWRKKHLRTLESCYGKRPGFDKTHQAVIKIYGRNHDRLMDLNLDLIRWLLEVFDIQVEVQLSSDLGLSSKSTERLIDIVRAHDGKSYITGTGSRDYLDTSLFADAGIEVCWQDFQHPRWDQGRPEFLSGLSALDALYQNDSPQKILQREEVGTTSHTER